MALLSYHFGPGQDALAYRQSQQHLDAARQLEADGHYEEAIGAYSESIAALPASDEPSADLALVRDQLRLSQLRCRFQLGLLAETLEGMHLLVADVEREHGADSPLAHDTRDFLGRVHYQAMMALRLESAEEEVWRRHWELSRQNFRRLAEHSDGARNDLDRRNLEVVIKSFNLPTPPTAAAAAAAAANTNGLNTVLAPPTVTPPVTGAGVPTTTDARPRQPTPDTPEPVANELELGS